MILHRLPRREEELAAKQAAPKPPAPPLSITEAANELRAKAARLAAEVFGDHVAPESAKLLLLVAWIDALNAQHEGLIETYDAKWQARCKRAIALVEAEMPDGRRGIAVPEPISRQYWKVRDKKYTGLDGMLAMAMPLWAAVLTQMVCDGTVDQLDAP